MDQPPRKSLMRNLGEMLGNISAGIFADPANPPARLTQSPSAVPPSSATPQPAPPPMPLIASTTVVNQRVQEAVVQTPAGPVVLRRTTTDEVLPSPAAPQPPRATPPLAK